ncbi:MAG UNVERIFIED_CONTAM: hypothetical protein LVR18_03755 [Planctomycetaceae bacterium]|jgi:chromosome segregation ATPase
MGLAGLDTNEGLGLDAGKLMSTSSLTDLSLEQVFHDAEAGYKSNMEEYNTLVSEVGQITGAFKTALLAQKTQLEDNLKALSKKQESAAADTKRLQFALTRASSDLSNSQDEESNLDTKEAELAAEIFRLKHEGYDAEMSGLQAELKEALAKDGIYKAQLKQNEELEFALPIL